MNNLHPYKANNIYCGECSEMMSHLPDGRINLTVTSPPYGSMRNYNGFSLNWYAIIKELYRITVNGGSVIWNTKDQIKNGSQSLTSFKQAIHFKDVGFNVIIEYAEKLNPQPQPTIKAHVQNRELLIIATKGKPNVFRPRMGASKYAGKKTAGSNGRNSGYLNTITRLIKPLKKLDHVWYYTAKSNGVNHPAPMNEQLVNDLIKCYSDKNDLILDPFMGSGTTAKMAIKNGRNYLGFEISNEYVELANERLNAQEVMA